MSVLAPPPSELIELLKREGVETRDRLCAMQLADCLDHRPPAEVGPDDRERLEARWGQETTRRASDALTRLGYGAAEPVIPRRDLDHGRQRAQSIDGLLGFVPRAFALRMPTTASNRRKVNKRNDGRDVWGPVTCSLTLRALHMGILAAVCALWRRRSQGEPYVDVTRSELAHLLSLHAKTRNGGSDTTPITQALLDFARLEISAEVDDDPRSARRREREHDAFGGSVSEASEAHKIHGTPIPQVMFWDSHHGFVSPEQAGELPVDAEADQEALLADRQGRATIRVYLSDEVRAAIASSSRRLVFVNFDVWRHLRASARRVYVYVQALHARQGGQRYFYLGDQVLFTLGLSGQRLWRAGDMVKADLNALYRADWRYSNGFGPHKHLRSQRPAFTLHPPAGNSQPRPVAILQRAGTRAWWQTTGRATLQAELDAKLAKELASWQRSPATLREDADRESVQTMIARSLASVDTNRSTGLHRLSLGGRGDDDEHPGTPPARA